MKYKYKAFIDFQKADPAGILYFAEVFPLAHICFEQFIAHINIGWQNWFNHPYLAAPIIHTECQYHAPLMAGQTYNIELSVEKMSSSTVNLRYIFASESITNHCEVKTVHTFIDKAKQVKTTIPQEYKDKLNPYLT